jgi:hypothetical protein
MNLHCFGGRSTLAMALRVPSGFRAATSVVLSLIVSGCGLAKIPSTQELEPSAFVRAVVDIAEHGDLSDSAYTSEALHFTIATDGEKREKLTNEINVTRQEYNLKLKSENFSRSYFWYATAKPDDEKVIRTQFGISLSSTPCITESIVMAVFHSQRTRSSVHDSGFTHSYDGKNGLGAAVTFGSESPCAGMLYMSQFTKS